MTLENGKESPLVIAHRGFSARYPENTLVAFEKALAHPIDGIELDVQWTRDEVAVCYHDRTLKKIGAQKIALRHRTYPEVANIDIGSWFHSDFAQQRLVRLEQALERFGTRTQLMIEIKRRERGQQDRLRGLMAQVIEMIESRSLQQQTALLCFDEALLRWGYQRAPQLRYVLNQTHPCLLGDDHFLFAYDVRMSSLNASFVKAAQQRGKKVFTYTINHERYLKRAVAMNVDGIMSDDPVWLRQSLESLS